MPELHEECGIAAVYQLMDSHSEPKNVTKYLPNILLDLQNRGQLSAGITSYHPSRDRLLQTYKDLGTVSQVFRMHHSGKYKSLIQQYSGCAAIGHVRYATSGREDLNFAQPFERSHGRKWKWFSIAFNGNLANFEQLKQDLTQKGYHITYNTDTEVMMHYLNKALTEDGSQDFKQIFAQVSEAFDGAYNIAFLNAEGDLVIMRDPQGIKPVCYGVKDDLLFVASESVALSRMGIHDFKDLPPGHILVASKGSFHVEAYCQPQPTAHCHFEWVYFSNLASVLDQRSVYQVRRALGEKLAANEAVPLTSEHIVVPIPETAKVAADAFAYHLHLPTIEGLVRNRYVGRTFIEGGSRQSVIERKFQFLPEVLKGKSVFLVDDSLVRATTMRSIIHHLWNTCEVKEVHVRIACPPIIAPCFYGIDIPDSSSLFTNQYRSPKSSLTLAAQTLDTMATSIGANTLRYLSVEDLCSAIGLPQDKLCTACVSEVYPTSAGTENHEKTISNCYN